MRPRVRSRRLAASLAVLVLFAVACNQTEAIRADAIAGSTPVTFATSDGVQLAGRLFGNPDRAGTGVVFSHMIPADQSSWFDFAKRVADQGYLAMTFDLRGYCPGGDAGCSEGDEDPNAAAVDLAAAVAFLRSKGAETVALVGASVGGTASLVVASQEGDAVAAVITLSAPQTIDGLVAGPEVLTNVAAAKLFIAGNGDAAAPAAAQTFFDEAQPPKRVEIVTSDDHGTELLEGNQAEIVRTLILNELAQYAPA
jgi:pimeloyl-ACP methyl ester carboxylesterase